MNRKERLISQIFRLLSLIETPANHSIIKQIEGLLNALRDEKRVINPKPPTYRGQIYTKKLCIWEKEKF